LAAGCTSTAVPTKSAATAVAAVQEASVTLRVEVKPLGATVLVDGQSRGVTPLTLTLPAGRHMVRVEKSGHQALEETLTLAGGEQAMVDGYLVDIEPPTVTFQLFPKQPLAGQHMVVYVTAYDNVTVARLELWIDGQLVLEEIGAAGTFHWTLPTEGGIQYALAGRAYDLAGNVAELEQTLAVGAAPPTATTTPTFSLTATPSPSPWPTITPSQAVISTSVASPSPTSQPSPSPLPTSEHTPTVAPRPLPAANVYYETTLTLDTFPYADYLRSETDTRYGVALWRLDRAAYEAAQPAPRPQVYRALIVENEYLQLTFLPELGGRLYRCVYKPTGQNIFYQNPVIKPSRWGPLPAEQNWWLAAGGMEWALPVNEHGYEFGIPWSYAVQATSQGVMVTLWDSESDERLRFEVEVMLPSGQAVFVVQPRLRNPLAQDVKVQMWLNAMLTLGSATIAPETEFVLPAGPVVVHSTGDAALAAAHETMSWPLYNGRDLSRYANWRQWLGLFVERTEQSFVGAYNHATGLGVARVFTPQTAPGVKLFAFGPEFGDRDHYTDDGSQYFELWSGPNRTFWAQDDVLLPAGGEITWQETWLPFASTGGLTYANEVAALYLTLEVGQVDVGLSVSRPLQGWLRLATSEEGPSLWEHQVTLSPGSPLRQQIALPASLASETALALRLTDSEGKIVLDYRHQD